MKYSRNTIEINRAGLPAGGRLGEIIVSIPISFKEINGNRPEIN